MTELAIVSSTGVEAHQATTDATTLVVSAADGVSGYATQTSWSAGDVDPAAVGREAAEKAARTRGAQAIEPGPYRAVLEPYALAELLDYFAFDAFSGLGLLEERAYLTGRLGERVWTRRCRSPTTRSTRAGSRSASTSRGRRSGGSSSSRTASLAASSGTARRRRAPATAVDGPRAADGRAAYGPLTTALTVDGGEVDSVEELCERSATGST